jgi:surface antigen
VCIRRDLSLLAAVLTAAALLAAPPASAFPRNATPYALPAPNRYNTTPRCPVSPQAPVCTWSTEPPYDRGNPEGSAPYYTPTDYFTNCAYWAAEKRPDIWLSAIRKYGYPAGEGAAAWYGDAVKAHYPVDHTPKVGDIAVWVPPYGHHVAYVEQVLADGSIVVSEMDLVTQSGRTGATELLSPTLVSDLWFIHLKPRPAHGPGSGQAVRRQMNPHVRYHVAGGTVRITIGITPGSGSASATAMRAGSSASSRLAVRRVSPSQLVITARLSPGLWELVIVYRPRRGYSRPRQTVLGVAIR